MITLRPEDFGAVPNSGQDCATAFNLMFNSIPETERRVVIELDGEYKIGSTVEYPKYNDRTLVIKGNNSVLKAVGEDYDILRPGHYYNLDQKKMLKLKGTVVNNALDAIDRLEVYNLKFENGNTQLTLAATFLSKIVDCQFIGGNRQIDGIFALQTQVKQCWFNAFKVEAILFRSGEGDAMTGEGKYFSNATGSNSQSNICTISDCRIMANKHGKIGVRSYSSSNLTIRDTVIEGATFKHAVHNDARGSTTVVAAHLENVHIEFNGPVSHCESILYFRGIKTVTLDRVYSQFGNAIQVHAKGSNIYCRNWSYFPSGGCKAEGGFWQFDNCWNLTEKAILDKDFWNGGEPPYWAYRSNSISWQMGKGFPAELVSKANNAEMKLVPGAIELTGVNSFKNRKDKIMPQKDWVDMGDYWIVDWMSYQQIDRSGNKFFTMMPKMIKKQ